MASIRALGKVALFAVAVAAIVVLGKGLYPADLPPNPSPDFIDNIFDNRGVLWVARLSLVSAAGVLAFGGIFIVLSIGTRVSNGEWLRRAGPFEVSEGRLEQAGTESEFWRRAALEHLEEADNLRERLARSEELIENAKKVR